MTRPRAQVATAVLLAVAAGCVDAVSYLVLHQTFTANMTGNTTKLGIAAGRANPSSLVPLAAALGTFIGAIALGTAALELAARRGLRATAAPAFAVEATLLAAFMLDGRGVVRHGTAPDHAIGGFYVLLTLAVLAMGVQTAAFSKALGATVRTTYVSGLITTFTQELVNVLAPPSEQARSYLRGELALGTRRESLRRVALHLAVFAGFLGGALWGAWGERHLRLWALALPLATLLLSAALDLRRGRLRGTGVSLHEGLRQRFLARTRRT